jgi:hypothetical protein
MIHGPPAPAVFSRILADVQANFAQLFNQEQRAVGYTFTCMWILGSLHLDNWSVHMDTHGNQILI